MDFIDNKLVLATHNLGKVIEIGALLKPFGLACISAGDLGLPEPEETGLTFAENAILKAEASAKGSGLVALADDSGLSVNALGGDPGIYSARWAGPEKDFALAMEKVHKALDGHADNTAAFVCVLALSHPDGTTRTFEGRIEGHLIWPMQGEKGFGYDPMFVPKGYDVTFGEMEPEVKHKISHRARAFEKMVQDCFDPAP